MSELQGLQLSMAEFQRRKVAVAAVVVDPVATNAELARDAGIAFPILSDPELRAVDAYRLRHRAAHDGKDIAHSASVLVDGAGVVRWTFITDNVRIRPLTSDVLAVIDALPSAGSAQGQ